MVFGGASTVCHGTAAAGGALAATRRRGETALGLHLALGVIVHEAGVGGQIRRRRRRVGDGDGVIGAGHDDGLWGLWLWLCVVVLLSVMLFTND